MNGKKFSFPDPLWCGTHGSRSTIHGIGKNKPFLHSPHDAWLLFTNTSLVPWLWTLYSVQGPVHHLSWTPDCSSLLPRRQHQLFIRSLFGWPGCHLIFFCINMLRIRIHWFWIRIQHSRLSTNSDPDLGFWWPKIKKKLQLNKSFKFFWSKIATYLFLGLHNGCLSYRRSLQPSKENIQHFKTFVGHFSPPGSGSRIPNPDSKHRPCPIFFLNFNVVSV